MPMSGGFDATTMGAPKQLSGESHPVGKKFPFTITNTEIKATKDGDGGMLVVEFTTPAGVINFRYNLWNKSDKACEIARNQLNLLCHVTGVFRPSYENDCAAFRNARGMIDVDYQKGNEPTTENPQGGYTEIKRMYDANGNEPGKAPTNAPQPQQWQAPNQPPPAAPMTQQPNGGWGAPAPTNIAPAPAAAPAGWQQNQPQGGNPPAPPWK